jgi:ADP-heptose:LPS heptosyltransferase
MKPSLSRPGSTRVNAGRGSKFRRLLDRYGGIPLVAIAGLARRRHTLPAYPRKIGLLNTAAIGDTVLMSGPIADLKEHYRRAQLIFFAGPSNYEVTQLLKDLDNAVRLDVFNPLRAIAAVRKEQPELLLDFGPWARLNALVAACSGARYLVGFKTPGEYRHFAYDLAVEHSSSHHELENFRRLVRATGSEAHHPPSLRRDLAHACKHYRPFVLFHLWPGGAGSLHKEWPQDRWKALTEILFGDGYEVVLSGGREQFEANERFITCFAPARRSAIRNIAGIGLKQLTDELVCADLAVSVNTGVMHIADALGVPLVALNGPTNARRWGPVSSTSISLQSPLAGCGYLDLGFEFPRRPPECMKAISLEVVLAACRSQLRSRSRERRRSL